MVIALLKAGWDENLHAVADGAHRSLDTPNTTISANLADQLEGTPDRAQRIINVAIEGQLGSDAEA